MSLVSLIDENQIREIIGDNCLFVKECVLEALRLHYSKQICQPLKQYLRPSRDEHQLNRIISMPVYIPGSKPAAGLKWIGSHPENFKRGMERANAIIVLNDTQTNAPMAVLSGSLISSMRTLATSLISIDSFRTQPRTVACIGMGKLGRLHARFLPGLYPSIERILGYSKTANFDDLLALPYFEKCSSYVDAIKEADVIVTTTAAASPYIRASDVSRDTLMINLSLMDFEPAVYARADAVVVDDWSQCASAEKVFKYCVDQGLIGRSSVWELSEVIYGTQQGSTFSGQIIVNPIGMAVEDIIVARAIYELVNHRRVLL